MVCFSASDLIVFDCMWRFDAGESLEGPVSDFLGCCASENDDRIMMQNDGMVRSFCCSWFCHLWVLPSVDVGFSALGAVGSGLFSRETLDWGFDSFRLWPVEKSGKILFPGLDAAFSWCTMYASATSEPVVTTRRFELCFSRLMPAMASRSNEQVVRQVKFAIAEEALQPGQLLPSIRALSVDLALNPNTVARAFQQLGSEGILESVRGRGLAVCDGVAQRLQCSAAS